MRRQYIENLFPGLVSSDYSIESPATPDYNCFAWAAGDTEVCWSHFPGYYWPSRIPRAYTIEAYIKAFETSGYTICKDAGYESGFKKIALYVGDNGKPTHAARQLSSGFWTSKLGKLEDIEHTTLEGLVGAEYGSVAVILKRPV
jgi:hypothetical protein